MPTERTSTSSTGAGNDSRLALVLEGLRDGSSRQSGDMIKAGNVYDAEPRLTFTAGFVGLALKSPLSMMGSSLLHSIITSRIKGGIKSNRSIFV